MLYLVILLFIQAITAHYIPHGESGRASSHPSRAVVGERLNHEIVNITKIDSINESANSGHTPPKKSDVEGGLIDLSMVARAHPWNIDRAQRDEAI
ncbi:hypothetical protein Pst134EA_015171 [Puccinia striiformis f. sp. tritici]|uniref:hypothetical protein n=1 Tax=Puccinia striiformis f. sp. tritici TaxID=168172 RepID=UPI000A1292A0|nr:hypothetical protein Pst134EA_015171 [Puccinia striiformis f. sp. tritici]KAH9452340.1 hypothetical protein Pst134EB_016298 [Puccinia striiformis f. sp. tritici]KAH9463085.1 hypothetical protein Pst134EA_015171 [Puccinia striiformis f. sp. tritici]